MFMRTALIAFCAAALAAAAQASSSCDTSSPAGCNRRAGTVAAQNKAPYAPAAAMLARALAERQSKLGEEHPFTLATANALAVIYKVQGQYGEAELLYLHTLEACERTLGSQHPFTLGTVKGLASLYMAEGRPAEAALLTKRAGLGDPTQYNY